MSGPQFFQTQMGRRFYEHTMPELVRQLTRLNDLVERLVEAPVDVEQPAEKRTRATTNTARYYPPSVPQLATVLVRLNARLVSLLSNEDVSPR